MSQVEVNMTFIKIAGIFQTREQINKFLQSLPSEFYAPYMFTVNQDLLLGLKNKMLVFDIYENEQIIVVEVIGNQLLKIQALLKKAKGRYVTPETLNYICR
ncbi:MAG: hypothetical protein V7L04_28845 [Nostoc sp.]|uniref:hypothetical protein n=1 Tax=Nostoc sp. TaxID=1180 RepID=UPI002FFBD4E8